MHVFSAECLLRYISDQWELNLGLMQLGYRRGIGTAHVPLLLGQSSTSTTVTTSATGWPSILFRLILDGLHLACSQGTLLVLFIPRVKVNRKLNRIYSHVHV